MSKPTVGIDIVGHDRTGAAAKSAEKRISGITKRAANGASEQASAGERAFARSGRGIIRTMTGIASASDRAFSGSSVTGGGSIIGRLGAVRQGAAAAAGGLGEASAASGVLGRSILGLAGPVGILAGLGIAAFKIADGFAKGANSMGNMASLIGVSTKGLQEFAGAAERVGVDKGTATSALGGLSQTLDDARYGRNSSALAVLSKLGVKMKTKADGTADTEAMLPDIADAITRQNSSGRRTAAAALGISQAALPAFTQGSKALSGSMTDYSKTGAVYSDEDVATGRKLTDRDVRAVQYGERGLMAVQRGAATGAEVVGDAAIAGVDAVRKNGPGIIKRATGRGQEEAASPSQPASPNQPGPRSAGWRRGGRMTPADVARHARAASRQYHKYRATGMSPDDAAAWAANGEAESGNDPHRQQPGGPGYGKFQWGSTKAKYDRRRDFQKVMGKSIYGSSDADQEKFRTWELGHTEKKAAGLINRAQGAGNKAAAIAEHYERPKETARDRADRGNIAEQIIKLEVSFKNAPPGTSAKAQKGSALAVSHAFPQHK